MWWVVSALAAESGCDQSQLATLATRIEGLQPSQIVAASAAAFAGACRGWNDVLEGARDVAVASPERRRSIDLGVAKHDDRWIEGCPGGPKALNESVRMPRSEGRAHLWEACELERLGAFEREEWVNGLDGLRILPIVAGVLLPEAGVDPSVVVVVVRGLAGLPPPPEAAARGPEMPTMAELAAADEAERTGTAAPVGDPAPTDELVITEPPAFKEGGQASVSWSAAALAAGGSCVAKIAVTPSGQLMKLTFVTCPEVLRDDVTRAAQASKYKPALAGDLAMSGTFTSRWTVSDRD